RHADTGAARAPAHRFNARHTARRRGHRQRLPRVRRDGRFREPSDPALLPGHPRHHPARAGSLIPLRAGRPALAGTGDRRNAAVAEVRLGYRGLDTAAWVLRLGYCGLDTAAWILRPGYCGLDTAAWILRPFHVSRFI